MKISLYCIGKTNSKELNNLINDLIIRLPSFISFQVIEIHDVKSNKKSNPDQIKKMESELILQKINNNDYIILLDEKGKQLTSVEFSDFLQQKMNQSIKNIIFLIGGAFGFSKEIYDRSNEKISLSKMTFTHQMIRLFFVEQLYRGFSILEGKPYHNE